MSDFIPFHRPSIGEEEINAVTNVLRSRWLTTGPVAAEFEKEFASYIGCKHAIVVNSATSALQLALDAIGLRPGEEVLVPAYTFTASAAVVVHAGGRPVLCDSAAGSFNVDPADAAKRVTSRTRAIMPVHIAGQACDLDAIREVADQHGLTVIEDAAHALPTTYNGRMIGTTSQLHAFSFYATKAITSAEGGMLTTDNDEFAGRAALMRLHGISGEAWKRYTRNGSWYYEVVDAGYKMNLPDLLAALGLAQLRRCDELHSKRQAIASMYLREFADCPELELPPVSANGDKHSWHLFLLRIRPEMLTIERNECIEQLKEAGIGTSVHFIPLHLHPFYARTYGYRPGDFPHAEEAYSRTISLPIYPDLTEQEVGRITSAVKSIVTKHRRSVWTSAA